jgi:hypothetical protein
MAMSSCKTFYSFQRVKKLAFFAKLKPIKEEKIKLIIRSTMQSPPQE